MSGLSNNIFTSSQPKVGICMPSSCTEEEIHVIANQGMFATYFAQTIGLITIFGSSDIIHIKRNPHARFLQR